MSSSAQNTVTRERPKGRSWADRKKNHGGTPAKPLPKRSTEKKPQPVRSGAALSIQHRRDLSVLNNKQLVDYQAAIIRELATRKITEPDKLNELKPSQLIVAANMFRANFEDLQRQYGELEKRLTKALFDLQQAQKKPTEARA